MGSNGKAIEKKWNSTSNAATPFSAPSGSGLSTNEPRLERDQPTTSTAKLPDDFSFLSEYLKDLPEADWATFCEATGDAVTKAQFLSLCTTLMSFVKMSAMEHLLPAIIKMVKQDPERFQTVQGNIQGVKPACSCSQTSVTCIEDEHKVLVLKDGVVTRIISKVRSIICCSYTLSATDTRSSYTLLQQLGITEVQVQNNVEETLKKLNLISSTTGPDTISATIAKEVVLKINSTLMERKTSLLHVAAITKSVNELIKDTRQKMSTMIQMPEKDHITNPAAGTSQRPIHSYMASAMGGTLTAVFSRIESCLNESNKSAKRWLISIKKVLIGQSGSMNIIPLNADLTSEQRIRAVSSKEFQVQAKAAISDILMRELAGFDSASCSDANVRGITTSNDNGEEMINQLPHFCQQPVEEAAASVIETFVVKIKTVAQSCKCKNISPAKQETEVSHGRIVNQVVTAATRIYMDVKMLLIDLFGHLALSGPQGHSESDPVLTLITIHSDTNCLLSPRQLDSCIKKVIKAVLSAFPSGKGQYLPFPSANSSLEDSILSQLSDMASSSSLFLTEDDFSEYSSNLTVSNGSEKHTESQSVRFHKRLSSVEFQMNAFEAVTDVLAASVQSHMSLQSSNVSDEMESLSEIPWAEFSSKDLDVVVAGIVDQFVIDIKMSAERFKSNTPTNSVDVNLSGNGIPSFLSTTSTVFQNLHDNLKKIFKQCSSSMRRGLSKKVKSANTKSVAESIKEPDVQGLTAEILMELLMTLDDQSTKDSTSSLVKKRPSTPAPFFENDSDEIVRPISEAIQKLSSEDIRASVKKDVSQILLWSAKKVVGQSCPLAAESTASDVTADIIEGLKTLLNYTSRSIANTALAAKGNNVTGIGNIGFTVLRGLQGKILKFFSKCQKVGTKIKGNTPTNAKKVISAALVCIKKDLSKPKDLQRSEDIQMIIDILNSMLKTIGEEDAQDDQEMTPVVEMAGPSSSPSPSRLSDCSSKFSPVSICELTADGSIVKHTYIDMHDQVYSGLPAGISKETITKVVETINEKLDLEDQLSMSSSPPHGSLHSMASKLQKSVSSSSLSDDLTGRLYRLLKKSSKTAVQKSASDTALLNTGRSTEMLTRKHVASQFVQSYAEETVKHFLLPCFNLPSPYTDEPESSIPASESASSRILLRILTDLINLLTEAMVKDVLSSFAQSDMSREDQTKRKNRRGIFKFLQRIPKLKVFSKKKSGYEDQSLNHDSVQSVIRADAAADPLHQGPSTSKQIKEDDQPKTQNPFKRLVTAMRRRKPE